MYQARKINIFKTGMHLNRFTLKFKTGSVRDKETCFKAKLSNISIPLGVVSSSIQNSSEESGGMLSNLTDYLDSGAICLTHAARNRLN